MENIVKFEASVIFEATIDTCGSCYLVIYGRHINGYFCAIPNFGISCEMAEPSDTFYNTERLIGAGVVERAARELAKAIKEIVNEDREPGRPGKE